MKRDTIKEFIQKASFTHNNKYTYDNAVYINSRVKLLVTCPTHGDFITLPSRHVKGAGCNKCYIDKISTTKEDYVLKAKIRHGDVYDYHDSVYNGSVNDITIRCLKHGYFTIKANAHLSGDRCKYCTIEDRSISNKEYIDRAKKVHGELYDYSKTKFNNTYEDVIIICKKHGEFKQKAGVHLRGSGCPICKSSKGELKILKILEDNNIKFIREHPIDDEYKAYKYDFYLPDLNILIEYDGIQHFKSIKHFGGLSKLKEQKARDDTKNKLAILHNYKLIRIPYTRFKNIEDYLFFRLSKYYIYRFNNKFYKNILDLCKGENLPSTTTIKDINEYKIYKRKEKL